MTYAEAIANLGDVRDTVLRQFALAGGRRDRWCRTDIRAMADAITHAEDFAELHTPKNKALRESLKRSRRRLEIYLEP